MKLTRKRARTTERGYFISGGEFRLQVAPWPEFVDDVLDSLGLDGRASTWRAVFEVIARRLEVHVGYSIQVDDLGDDACVLSKSTEVLDRFSDVLEEALADRDRAELLLQEAAAHLGA